MKEPIRLLLADDHEVTRAGFAAMLADCPEFSIVGQAVDGRQALELCQRLNPDIAILDIRMPQLNGLATARLLREQQPSIKVLLFTMYDSPDHLEAAVNAGAVGYLLKDAPEDELYDAVVRASQRTRVLSPQVANVLADRLVNPAEALSAREIELLRALQTGASNREIAEQLFISQATVKTHLIHIYAKLGVDNRTAAVEKARQRRII